MSRKKLFILFVGAFIFRLLLLNVAYHGDLNNNISWGNALLKYGANGYYEQKIWQFSQPNQPPLYILLFGLTSFLYQSISNLTWYLNNNVGIFPSSFIWFWQEHGMTILVKMPSILADLGIGYLIYRKVGLKFAAVWLFNPITWYNGAIWGQTDPVVNLLGLISVLFLLKRKLIPSILFFVVSMLFKGSLAIFFPIVFIVLVLQKHRLQEWLRAILISAVVVTLVSLPFHLYIDLPTWLFNLYTKRFFPGEIGYLTANAFNFWYLVNSGKVLDSIVYYGLSAKNWGYLITILVSSFVLYKQRKDLTKEKNVLLLLAVFVLTTFLFFTRIHERYLYPFFPIATLLLTLTPELIVPYIVLSLTFLLNMYNLFWAPSIPFLENIMKTTVLSVILAITNLLIFLVIVRLSIKKS